MVFPAFNGTQLTNGRIDSERTLGEDPRGEADECQNHIICVLSYTSHFLACVFQEGDGQGIRCGPSSIRIALTVADCC
jgi:hypothetical protein